MSSDYLTEFFSSAVKPKREVTIRGEYKEQVTGVRGKYVTTFKLLCEIDSGGHVKPYCSPGKGF